jgi:hypothetical protein
MNFGLLHNKLFIDNYVVAAIFLAINCLYRKYLTFLGIKRNKNIRIDLRFYEEYF